MTVTSITKVEKKRLSIDYIVAQLRSFYRTKSTITFNRFCKERKIKRSNLAKIWNASGLAQMKEKNEDVNKAMQVLRSHLETRNLQNSTRMKQVHKSNEIMTDSPEPSDL